MKKRSVAGVALAVLLNGSYSAWSAGDSADAEVAGALQKWGSTDCSVDALMNLYHPRAVLRPTAGRELAASPDAIRQYFTRVCSGPRLKGTVGAQNIRVFGDKAVNSGTMTYTGTRADGSAIKVQTRYSFAYRREDGRWLIVEHHSSMMPAEQRR